MTPDTFDAGFGQQPFHLILKFLSYEVIFQNRDDQDFFEFWQRLIRHDPAVNNFCASEKWNDRQDKKAEPKK